MSANILPFAVRNRWIVTVESERVLVKVRHRTLWLVVARRLGNEDQVHWVASEQDAYGIAEMLREAKRQLTQLEHDPAGQRFAAWFRQQPQAVQQSLVTDHRKAVPRMGKTWSRRTCLSRTRHR